MLKGKVAVITGGASGMGKAAAMRLASEGVKICLLDADTENMKEAKSDIEKINSEVIAITCDISHPEEVQQGIKEAVEKWGRLDIVFANAGITGVLSPIETMKVENWQKVMGINLQGTFLTVKYAIPYLKKQGGSIIITSSISGNRVFSQTGFAAYSTSKSALAAFMKMAALELASYKIRVNAICPGGIDTNFAKSIEKSPELEEVRIPIKFPEGDKPLEKSSGKPEQVADLVQFLASDLSEHISGTEVYIDGTESLLRG